MANSASFKAKNCRGPFLTDGGADAHHPGSCDPSLVVTWHSLEFMFHNRKSGSAVISTETILSLFFVEAVIYFWWNKSETIVEMIPFNSSNLSARACVCACLSCQSLCWGHAPSPYWPADWSMVNQWEERRFHIHPADQTGSGFPQFPAEMMTVI